MALFIIYIVCPTSVRARGHFFGNQIAILLWWKATADPRPVSFPERITCVPACPGSKSPNLTGHEPAVGAIVPCHHRDIAKVHSLLAAVADSVGLAPSLAKFKFHETPPQQAGAGPAGSASKKQAVACCVMLLLAIASDCAFHSFLFKRTTSKWLSICLLMPPYSQVSSADCNRTSAFRKRPNF
jgi:hypothetical protein